jgi:hypothetical protein
VPYGSSPGWPATGQRPRTATGWTRRPRRRRARPSSRPTWRTSSPPISLMKCAAASLSMLAGRAGGGMGRAGGGMGRAGGGMGRAGRPQPPAAWRRAFAHGRRS